MAHLKHLLSREFEIKDLGHLKYFLGMEVVRSSRGIYVSQRKYTFDLLRETEMSGCKPVETPMDPNAKLGNIIQGEVVDRGRYQRLVGKLIYLTHTRPYISFISQFLNKPSKEHMEVVYCILRYLKNDPGKGLMFKKTPNRSLEIYTMLIGLVPLSIEGQLQGIVCMYGEI